MIFFKDKTGLDFLKGVGTIDCGYHAQFAGADFVKSREGFIYDFLEKKSVLHVGCIDHVDLLHKKITDGTWLHANLTKKASKCYGVDINKAGVEECRGKHGINNVFYADITKSLPVEIENQHFDYILFAEVLEHICNPQLFLKQSCDVLRPVASSVLVTVPYAFNLDNFSRAKNNFEEINTDHRFWFTPYTITKILVDSGLAVTKVTFADYMPHGIFSRLSVGKAKSSAYYKTIIVEGTY